MAELGARQVVPLSYDEQEALHREAARVGLSHGLLSRLYLAHGLDHGDDPEMVERIEAEKDAAAERIRAGAKTAAQARWGTKSAGEKEAGER